MLVQLIQVVQNDYGYQLPFTLEDALGNAVNLTGATVNLAVQSAQDPSNAFKTIQWKEQLTKSQRPEALRWSSKTI